MTTVFWRKDDPDDFQVKDVNVPGVFPQPSSKIDSYTVTTAVKPWLRPRRKEQESQPPTSTHKHSKVQGAPLEAREPSSSRSESGIPAKSKVSASLKDLSSEDKKRVANLIKELARAGEERKLAVNALHQERSIFQGKEESLKRQQERLIAERDELREKILEYQFLINQYSKQLQHEKEGLQVEERYATKGKMVSSVKNRVISKDSLITSEGNIKPPLPMREENEKIQTYYTVKKSTDSRHCREIDKIDQSSQNANGCMEEHPRANDFVSIGAAEKDALRRSMDGKTVDSRTTLDPTGLKDGESQTYVTSPAKDMLLQTSKVPGISNISKDSSNELEIQKTLVEQQNRLFEQQKVIQQQLEHLQALQNKYTQEFSQIVTYSEGLKQVLTAEKSTFENSNQHHKVAEELASDDVSESKLGGNDHSEEMIFHDKNISDDDERRIATDDKDTPYNKHDSREQPHQQSTIVADSVLHTKKQEITLDSHVNKSIEQIPGYLLHANNNHLKQNSTSVITPDKSLLRHSSRENTHNSGIYTLENSVILHATSHQKRHGTSLPHSLHHGHSRKQSPSPVPLSTKSYNHTYSETLRSATRRKETITDTERKQHSLLQSLEDLDSELLGGDDNENLFIPESYTGFARNILEGKFRNEQIFASTDYSDNESEPDDNELIADMFFLKRS